MGSHRYPVGFSGDVTELSWQCMAFQPYFSVTASNVAYGYISHDLVGPPHDHELHVRWMQFGAFSGVMRIHDRGMSAGSCWPDCAIVDIWDLPFKYFEAIRDAMQRRVALLPYTYTALRHGYDTGVSLIYPLYYDWPSHDEAYQMNGNGQAAEYMFGPDILVAPICQAGDSNQIATKTIWLPPSTWYDDVFGELVEGGGSITHQFDLSEIPLFVRAGSIIPRIPNPGKTGVGSQPLAELDIYIYPGGANRSYSLYEDDITTLDYIKGSFTRQTIRYTRHSSSIVVVIDVPSGSFPGQLKQRNSVRIFFVGSVPIANATVDGVSLVVKRFGGPGTITYDGKSATAIVDLGETSTTQQHTVVVNLAIPQQDALLRRAKGYASRMLLAKRIMDNYRETPYSVSVGPGMFKQAGAHGVELSYLAVNSISLFTQNAGSAYLSLMKAALAELGGSPSPPSPTPAMTSLVQLWSASRKDMLLCGTPECLAVNGDYETMWVEGYQPVNANTQGVIPLNDFYSNEYHDNYADVIATPPDSYLPAVFSNGYVMQSNATGLVCLQVWVSPSTNDHMTLASPQGLQWALEHSYVKTDGCVAYAYASPPSPKPQENLKPANRKRPGDVPTSAAQELLNSIINAE